MTMTYIRTTVLAYFLTDSLNWPVVRKIGKEKYLLNSLYEKWKSKVSLKQM